MAIFDWLGSLSRSLVGMIYILDERSILNVDQIRYRTSSVTVGVRNDWISCRATRGWTLWKDGNTIWIVDVVSWLQELKPIVVILYDFIYKFSKNWLSQNLFSSSRTEYRDSSVPVAPIRAGVRRNRVEENEKHQMWINIGWATSLRSMVFSWKQCLVTHFNIRQSVPVLCGCVDLWWRRKDFLNGSITVVYRVVVLLLDHLHPWMTCEIQTELGSTTFRDLGEGDVVVHS